MVSVVEQKRLEVSRNTHAKKKSDFGQYLTPEKTAAFMAGLFPNDSGDCRLLDAGAGIGSLTVAFLDRWRSDGFDFKRMEVDAFEVDPVLVGHLQETLNKYRKNRNFSCNIYEGDFIHAAVESLAGDIFSKPLKRYTHAILNPPYKKISSDSAYRLALRRVGIETVNLYSAFVALAVSAVAPGGQIVAIIPRSFCNGPYYRPFRDFILEYAAIRHVHLFGSRDKAFKDDKVLQENIILRLERDGSQGPVTISTSTDDDFYDLSTHEHPFNRIVLPDDPQRFIHVPTTTGKCSIEMSSAVRCSLDDIGVSVSTGPVVDFRVKAHLRDMPEAGAVPLIYPGHLGAGGTTWPLPDLKKPNAIMLNEETEKWLYPKGYYCAVRRFSSKEEKRRIVASVVEPDQFRDYSVLGIENHINVFHKDRRGLSRTLAHGLAAFLNTTAVDEYFRRFNGHTQVNATDLKLIKYPSHDRLVKIGEWAIRKKSLTQDEIDTRLRTFAKKRGPGKKYITGITAGRSV